MKKKIFNPNLKVEIPKKNHNRNLTQSLSPNHPQNELKKTASNFQRSKNLSLIKKAPAPSLSPAELEAQKKKKKRVKPMLPWEATHPMDMPSHHPKKAESNEELHFEAEPRLQLPKINQNHSHEPKVLNISSPLHGRISSDTGQGLAGQGSGQNQSIKKYQSELKKISSNSNGETNQKSWNALGSKNNIKMSQSQTSLFLGGQSPSIEKKSGGQSPSQPRLMFGKGSSNTNSLGYLGFGDTGIKPEPPKREASWRFGKAAGNNVKLIREPNASYSPQPQKLQARKKNNNFMIRSTDLGPKRPELSQPKEEEQNDYQLTAPDNLESKDEEKEEPEHENEPEKESDPKQPSKKSEPEEEEQEPSEDLTEEINDEPSPLPQPTRKQQSYLKPSLNEIEKPLATTTTEMNEDSTFIPSKTEMEEDSPPTHHKYQSVQIQEDHDITPIAVKKNSVSFREEIPQRQIPNLDIQVSPEEDTDEANKNIQEANQKAQKLKIFDDKSVNFFEFNLSANLMRNIETPEKLKRARLKNAGNAPAEVKKNQNPIIYNVRDEYDTRIIQPKYMELYGSMPYTEFWSDQMKKEYADAFNRDAKHTKTVEEAETMSPYRPHKAREKKSIKMKLGSDKGEFARKPSVMQGSDDSSSASPGLRGDARNRKSSVFQSGQFSKQQYQELPQVKESSKESQFARRQSNMFHLV